MANELVIASTNPGKVKEIKEILLPLELKLYTQSELNIEDVEETGLSFVENAILKARHASKFSEKPAIADDSGLCVDALGGSPGIYSARYSGPDSNPEKNIEKLLGAISSLQGEDRKAQFYCAVAYVRHANDPIPMIFQASWTGRILTNKRGDGGFGYDPIFFVPNHNCTAAELSPDLKNALSHRAKAFKAFVTAYAQQYALS